jgi:hypothetical protein
MFYETILVLGSKPDTATWDFPSHVYASLDEAAQLLHERVSSTAIVSGKWAFSFDKHGIHQPFRECDKMARYLIDRGVDSTAVLREGESKDTIANLYEVKRHFLVSHNWTKLLLITADFRANRIHYLSDKILGPSYDVTIQTVPSHPGESYPLEAITMRRTKEFLGPMQSGDDAFLDGTFYAAPYYHYQYTPEELALVNANRGQAE